jgi:hypothetical protein
MTLQSLIDAIVENGKVSESKAHHVVRVYRRLKLFTMNGHDGYVLKHGALLDREVIERAANQSMPEWVR